MKCFSWVSAVTVRGIADTGLPALYRIAAFVTLSMFDDPAMLAFAFS